MKVTYWSLGALLWQRKAPWIWCMVESQDIYLSICLSVFLSVYWYIYLPSNLYINLSIYRSIHLSSYLLICLSLYLSIYQSFFISIYLFIYLSISLSICLSIELSIYLSVSYLSIFLSLNLSICNVMIYSSVYVYLDNGIIEMLFDHDWLEILLQKKLLNQRERTCCLNLNWWNNLNLIVTLSNFWDALPSLVNTEKFIISYGYRKKISFIFLVMLVFKLKISFLLIYIVYRNDSIWRLGAYLLLLGNRRVLFWNRAKNQANDWYLWVKVDDEYSIFFRRSKKKISGNKIDTRSDGYEMQRPYFSCASHSEVRVALFV